MGKRERIDKVLSNMGYGSRKDIKKLIKQGRVAVDGKIISENSIKIDPYNTRIEVDNNLVEYKEFIYLMMNKPGGVVSSTDDTLNTTVVDIIDDKYRIFNPFPVGRLDKDTEGLLILSNDGQLAHKLLSPKKHVNKMYYVEVDGLVKDIHVDKFKEGIILDDGYKTLPGQLEIIDSGPVSRVYVTIREGKYHQVKRMFKAIGMKVTYLKRISMGKLKLDNSLLPGEYRELSEKEVEILWQS